MRIFEKPLILLLALIGTTTAALAQDAAPEPVTPPDAMSPDDGMMGEGDMSGMMEMMQMMQRMGPMMDRCDAMMAAMTDHIGSSEDDGNP